LKTIIAGGRDITNYDYIEKAIAEIDWEPTVVVSGTARGADLLGEEWAKKNNIPIERYPAEWDFYGKSAGYIRNKKMAKNAEALIALWDGESRGTKHMIDIAEREGLVVSVYMVK